MLTRLRYGAQRAINDNISNFACSLRVAHFAHYTIIRRTAPRPYRVWAVQAQYVSSLAVCQVRAAQLRSSSSASFSSSLCKQWTLGVWALSQVSAACNSPSYLLLLVMQLQLFCLLLHVVLLLPMMVAPDRAHLIQYQMGDLIASPLAVAPARPQVITPFRGSPSVALLAPLSPALRLSAGHPIPFRLPFSRPFPSCPGCVTWQAIMSIGSARRITT